MIDEPDEPGHDEEEGESDAETLVDILSGQLITASAKNRLVQNVVRQLIESYGFDRTDLRVAYRLTTAGKRGKSVDIAILRHGQDARDENIERVIVCQPQKPREKLRSPGEAAADLRKLHEKLDLLPACHLGLWTNGLEQFFVRGVETTFETRFIDIGAWPAPGEATDDAFREGGATQVPADPEGLEAALRRCHLYLTKNRLLGGDSFKPLGALLLAKLYDETRTRSERQFWIRGDEPFTAEGQEAIRQRITACFEEARRWQPNILLHGWDLGYLNASQLARVVTELARYSLADSLPLSRTFAIRSGASSTMDGKEGRYPTPLNVAQMAVSMLDPGPTDRIFDGSSGTGTFLATAAAHMFEKILSQLGATVQTATTEHLLEAHGLTAAWAKDHVFGCDLSPSLVVTTRLNLLLTAGHPGNVFHVDARSFPHEDLEDVARARGVIPDESMDLVLTNPWFSSTKDRVTDETILRHFHLGREWKRTDESHFVESGSLNTAGVPPEVLFLERAWRWAKPGTGRIAILLPDGLLGNPSDEFVRWWILQNCEVLASVDLPIEPFKVTLKDYRLTPALPSLVILRRRGHDELKRTTHPDYWVFMAVANRAGVDARGNPLVRREPDGQEVIVEEEVIERVRIGGQVQSRAVLRRHTEPDDELPIVADHYRKFEVGGRQNS